MATSSTNSLLRKQDQAYLWHPFTQIHKGRIPPVITRAKGVYLYEEDGTAYIDGISSWGVNLHGHTHPFIADAIKTQVDILEQVIFADFSHPQAITLAEKLCNLLSMSKLFYSDNGSTSIEVALKIALQYWYNQDKNSPKTKVVCFKNSYHGDTFGAMSVAGESPFNRPFKHHLFQSIAIDPPLPGQEERSYLQLKTLLEKEDVACLIFEPLLLGVGGMLFYQPEGLNPLLQLCRSYGVLTIADEVLTGFGRTDTLFACDTLEEKPDLLCLSKGLTGGFLPLGATLCQEKVFQAFVGSDPSHAFLHGHSYTANPLACSSALASLTLLLQQECFSKRNMIANAHRSFCHKWQSHPKLKRCESLGTVLALEYKVDKTTYFHPIRDRLYDFFLSKQILLRPLGNVVYLLPPYCITEELLHYIYEQIAATLEGDL